MQPLVFGVLGGLGLFLFGMRHLSENMQKIAGTKLKSLMKSLTNNRFKGLFLGSLVTSIVQSSSVTTVMLVGLINAGIISLAQSVGVIFGANIGTTITAQIIAFKITKYSLPMIAIGILIFMLSKNHRNKLIGEIIFSLGLIFLGLTTMGSVLKPLKDSPMAINALIALGKNPLLGVTVGTLVTVMVQSSSASIGMLIALSGAGLIDFNAALYILLGDNIGTTITAWLASIGGNSSAKRMALIHSLFNILGACYFVFIIKSGYYAVFIDYITPGPITPATIGRNIANAHSCFNIINAIIFIPFVGILVKIAEKVITKKDIEEVSGEMEHLQEHLLPTPDIAIIAADQEIKRMAEIAFKAFDLSTEVFFKKNTKFIKNVNILEDAVDSLQENITMYLSKLAIHELSPEISKSIPKIIHTVNDIERISDHAVNIVNIAEKSIEANASFSKEADNEINSTFEELKKMIDNTLTIIGGNTEPNMIKKVFISENELNNKYRTYLNNHTKRFEKSICKATNAFIFVDILNNFEKIGDHLTNIAQASLGENITIEQTMYEETMKS